MELNSQPSDFVQLRPRKHTPPQVTDVRPLRVLTIIEHFRRSQEIILVLKVLTVTESGRGYEYVWVNLSDYLKASIMATMKLKLYLKSLKSLKPRKFDAIKSCLPESLLK